MRFFLFLVSFCFISFSFAADLQIKNPRIHEAPPVAPVSAGYLTLANPGNKAVTIIGTQSDAFENVEIHSMSMKDGMMHMEKQETFTIPAKSDVELKPGGYHLMLFKPKQTIVAGQTIRILFTFSDQQTQEISFPVIKPDAQTHDHSEHDHSMHH